MVNKSKKRAFSLVDAIIILLILAVAIVAATPILTRKTVNYTELGTSATGISKGAYEIFSKELVKFGNGAWYEKGIDPNVSDGVILYERKTDSDYKTITGALPVRNLTTGRKSTLYEEFNTNLTPIRNDRGEIVSVKFKRTNASAEETIQIGGRYIIENANIKYYVTNDQGVRQKGTLPSNQRIIEGQLTKRNANPASYNGHPLWHIASSAGDDFIGEVKTIPWERLYDGNKLVKDQPLQGNTGRFFPEGRKNVTIHAVGGGGAGGGLKVDANGSAGKFLSAASSDANDIKLLKKELALKFKDATGASNTKVNSPWNIFNWLSWWFPNREQENSKGDDYWINKFVKHGYNATVDTTAYTDAQFLDYSSIFEDGNNKPSSGGTAFSFYNPLSMWTNFLSMFNRTNDDGGKYITINKGSGTITVKVDVRQGKYQVFPHQLFDYTAVLGSKTQDSVKYAMPEVFTFNDIIAADYYIAAVGCGSAGKGGTSLEVAMDGDILDVLRKPAKCPGDATKVAGGCSAKCKKDASCKLSNEDKKYICSVDDLYSELGARKQTDYGRGDTCTADQLEVKDIIANCSYKCDSTYYTFPATRFSDKGSCAKPATCEKMDPSLASYKPGSCKNTYLAGEGGKQPGCAIACAKIDGPMTAQVSCHGTWIQEGTNGGTKHLTASDTVNSGGVAGVISGFPGRSCSMTVSSASHHSSFGGWWTEAFFKHKNTNTAYSLGGTGGHPHYFFRIEALSGEGYLYNDEALKEFGIARSQIDYRDFVETEDGSGWKNLIATHSNMATCTNADGTPNAQCTTLRSFAMFPLVGFMPSDAGFFAEYGDECGMKIGATPKMKGYPQEPEELKTRSFSACAYDKTASGIKAKKGIPDPRGTSFSPKTDATSKNMNDDKFEGIFNWWQKYADAYDINNYKRGVATGGAAGVDFSELFSEWGGMIQNYIPEQNYTMPSYGGTGSDWCKLHPFLKTCKSANSQTDPEGNKTVGQGEMPAGIDLNKSYKPSNQDAAQKIEGIWNHVYTWTIPYATNQLAYGESGQVGEYKTTTISEITGPLEITLGKGGQWNIASNDWQNSSTFGPNGTDTVVKMMRSENATTGGREVIRAKGGRGGASSQLTDRYQICYTNGGKCKSHTDPSVEIDCCSNEAKTTKDIIATALKLSLLETKRALVGKSAVIGLGMGRGGEGAITASGRDELSGMSVFGNSSASGLNWDTAHPNGTTSAVIKTETAAGTQNAKDGNYVLSPSALNFKGGEGAVIITW